MKCLSIPCNPSFWLLLFLSFICFFAEAATNPQIIYSRGSVYESSGEAVCSTSGLGAYEALGNQTVTTGPVQSGDYWLYRPIGFEYGRCGSEGITTYQNQACPYSGETQIISGSMICGTGELEYDCPASGTSGSHIITDSVSGSMSISGTNLCTNNGTSGGAICQATCTGGVVAVNSVAGTSTMECSSYSFTGNQCTPSDVTAVSNPSGGEGTTLGTEPDSSGACSPGTAYGTINGEGVCLPTGSEYTGDTTTITNPDGTTATQTTINTVVNGGTSITTTTNITNAGGDTVATGSTTTTPGVGSPGTDGEGKQQKPPDLGPAPVFDDSLPEDVGFQILTQPNPVFSTQIFQVSASCPNPIVYEAMGQTFSIEFDGICDLGGIIRGIILMLSAIIAIRAVVSA